MNLREGTRRLALLLGVLGVMAGGFASYAELQSVLALRTAHNHFEQLASSPVVQQARNSCLGSNAPSGREPWDRPTKVAAQKGNPWDKPNSGGTVSGAPKRNDFLTPPYCFIPESDPNSMEYTPSESNSSGMKTIHFENREIASIDTVEGQTLYPTPAPGVWSYFLIAILPVLGFLAPWCVIRAIGWVGAGFVKPAA